LIIFASISVVEGRVPKKYDAFVSHASEDKENFVRPMAEFLKLAGVEIWYDEFSLSIGDSLSRSIDKGLARSKFGIVVLSEAFFKKRWTEYELSGLISKEMDGGRSIIPVWLNISKKDVLKFSPTLADKFALSADKKSIEAVGIKIIEVVRPDLFARVHQRLATMQISRTAKLVNIDPKSIKLAPLRHAKLSSELTSRVRLIRAALLDVYPMSMAAWIDGFRRDTTPESEIAIWERISSVYLECSYGKPRSARKNIYKYVSDVLSSGRSDRVPVDIQDRALSGFPVEDRERESYSAQSENIIASDEEERTVQAKKTGVTTGIPSDVVVRLRIDELNLLLEAKSPIEIDLSEVRHAPIKNIVSEAGVVLGRDKRTGRQSVFYGSDTLRQFASRKDGGRFPRPVVVVSYDGAGDQLEYLIATIIVLKGGCCYSSGSDRPESGDDAQ
jgi:hypothetical protein